MAAIVLDHIDKIIIDKLPISNTHVIDQYEVGIEYLAQLIRQHEIKFYQANPGTTFCAFASFHPIIYCSFDWFVIYTTNYIRTIGLLDILNKNKWDYKDISNNAKPINIFCTNYVTKVVPELYEWRNKISAHTAATAPRDENYVFFEYSLMDKITFSNRHFEAGGGTYNISNTSATLPKWALTEVYETTLIPRYWPHKKLPKLL
jgi:hypothetical protein